MSVSVGVRFSIFRRDGFRCRYCGITGLASELEVDHVEPVSAGGRDTSDNLVTSCVDCNRGKAAHRLYEAEVAAIMEDPEPFTYGRWVFDEGHLSIIPFAGVDSYDVPLRDIRDGRSLAHWIGHLRAKRWASAEDVRDFYLAASRLTPFARQALLESEMFA